MNEVVHVSGPNKPSLKPDYQSNHVPVAHVPFLGMVLKRMVASQSQALLDATDFLIPFLG